MSEFAQLHPSVQHHVVNTLGWPRLRPLQAAAIQPVREGHDALLLAPTAGGKTEAATFPLLTRAVEQDWPGLAVLYLCPLKALLNNLRPRLESYASWVGRDVGVRHGDTSSAERRRQLLAPPSMLLTTPESLESMLVSRLVDERRMFSTVRAVVVDEIHAFAGDDRGWHLLAVLDRVERLAGRPLQRVGLSATVGNPAELLAWLQGPGATERAGAVVTPEEPTVGHADLTVDYVGSPGNAAQVLSVLHRGEKRLAFCDSRRRVEEVAGELRQKGIETFVSHSSLSVGERRRAEKAFSEARDCVIVSTSTLELGIDVGDLDRVLQIGAPVTVASLLQRLGRTGRRPGTCRNMTFLAIDEDELLRAAGLVVLLGEGFVEPITPPPRPLHIAAQQILALALQEGQIDLAEELPRLVALGLGEEVEIRAVASWLLHTGHLDQDGGLAFVGPAAERRYGRRHFLELLAVFSAPPEVTVLHGREEIGSLDATLLMLKVQGPRVVALAGRPWRVTHVDWKRRRAYVEPSTEPGRARWGGGVQAYSYPMAQAIRRVLLGVEPRGVVLSQRAIQHLGRARETYAGRVLPEATVIRDESNGRRWWTFAGLGTNAVLTAALDAVAPHLLDEGAYDNLSVQLRDDASAGEVAAALKDAYDRLGRDLSGAVPRVSEAALRQLKFSDLLPPALATATLASRIGSPVTTDSLTRAVAR